MKINHRINSMVQLGKQLNQLNQGIGTDENVQEFNDLLIKAESYNPWFTQDNLRLSFSNIAVMLEQESLQNWVSKYPAVFFEESEITIATIMAGNIPMVGFHDFLSILLSGKNFMGKLASPDQFLLPFVAEKLVSIEPMFETKIGFESHVLKGFDAVIATGSNNSARYFDYYFGKYPHIIRQNRHSVAIITGNEGTDRLKELGKDVFNYFGLGCRNVSKVLLPENYPIPQLLDQFQSYYSILQHNKYVNNYEYNKSLYLINKQAHLDTGFLLLVENTALSSPVGVLHYEYYSDLNTAIRQLKTMEDQIQCVLSEEKGVNNAIIFGESQKPGLMDYADNVDVMRFLGGLSK